MKKKIMLLAITSLLLIGCATKNKTTDSSSKVEESSSTISSSVTSDTSKDESSEQSSSEEISSSSEEESSSEEISSEVSSESSSSEEESSSSEEIPETILIDNISLSETSIDMFLGDSAILEAVVSPSNATNQSIHWVVEQPNVISIDEDGWITGIGVGSTNVYALPDSEEQKSSTFTYSTCLVTVNPLPEDAYDYDGYYEDLSWNNGQDLINKLHAIISSDYTSLKYEGNWDTNRGADQALDDFEMVDVVYSDENQLKTATYANGKGWQREHAFAASLMTGFTSGDAVGVHKGRATDFHNLFASNFSGNTSRGNKNFGVANVEDETYQDFGSYTFDAKNFEPSDYDKGRLSRAIFYMAVMYNEPETETVKVTLNYNDEDKVTYGKASTTVPITVTYQPLQIVEEYVPYSKYTYTSWYYKIQGGNMTDEDYQAMLDTIEYYGEGAEGYTAYSMANCQYAIGNLSTLLDWNSYDVDLLEMQHNNYVYSQSGQGNRNPFVDYPELVDYCFGSKKDQPGSLKDIVASYTMLEMDKDEINHYAISSAKREYDEGSTFKVGDYTIKAVKNNLSFVDASYEDQTVSYTFTSADAILGKKTLTITTPINAIKLNVVVNSGAIDSCSYQGLVVNAGKNNFKNGESTNVDGQSWDVSWTNATGAMGSKDSTYGLGFGVASGGKTMGELTLATTDAKTVNKVYFKGSCKAGETIDVTIKVGDEVVCQKSITRTSGVTTAPEVVGASFASKTGVISFIIGGSGASNGAIYVHTLAFNVAS